MKNLYRIFTFAFLSVTIILATACSSDSGSTGTSSATITDANAQALATAGTEGVKQAVNNETSNPFARPAAKTPVQRVTELSVQQAQASQDSKLAASDINICDEGTADGFDTLGENGGTVTFNDCVLGGATINGTMTIITSTSGSVITYSINANFTISYLDEVETVNYSSTCTIDQNSGTTSCTYSSTGTGIDGRSYSVSDIDISGDAFSGYTVSATVTDPDFGTITITTTTPVTFNCPNGQPDAGVIVVSDGTNSMTVTFIDCNSFSIDYNGSTTVYNW